MTEFAGRYGDREPQILLRTEQVQELTNLGRSTIYELIQRGDLKAIRIGRSVRIRRSDLEAFIDARSGAND